MRNKWGLANVFTRKEEIYRAWYAQPVEEILEKLGTSIDGLTEDEAKSRLEKFGPNVIAEVKKPPLIVIVLHQFKSPLIYILLIAGFITILLRDFVDASVIFGVVVLNAVIGFIQEYKAEESIRALKKLLAPKAIVVRAGLEREIDAELIVPGDIVLLRTGQKVPADLRLIQVKEFRVDESAFTGESVPVQKTSDLIPKPGLLTFEQKDMAFMGSIVASGRATAVVVATGPATQLGQISEEVKTVGPVKTPLQERIEMLSRYIIFSTSGFGFAGFVIGILQGENPLQLLLAVIAMAVAVVPEGLPIALTIALAVAVNRMAKKNAIVRYLPAIEALGSSTVIGSDKTGTLTRNQMTVQKIWAGGNTYTVEGVGYEPLGRIFSNLEVADLKSNPLLEWTLRIGLLANESNLVQEDGIWKAHGDPTEVALIVSALRGGLNEEKERLEYPILDILPFESELRYMATLNAHDRKVYLLVKGAPEKLLSLSRKIAGTHENAESVEMYKAAVMDKVYEFADEGLRVLGMAYKEMPPGTDEIKHEDVNDLIFVGLQGMMDPPRPEAIEAVACAKLSGIRVLMITGDNAHTALSIAKMMGITGSEDKAITGREMDEVDDIELQGIVQTTSVFARVSPHHKLRIVNALKENGEVVAVTGDGVNDAAALKAAHIGIAMGITGTDVAKEASDMVVVDDNFASIYRAIIEGRVAFDNIRKVTYFLLATGAGMLVAVFTTIVTVIPLIMLPAQILWVNLVTNGLQDVSLAFDPKEPGVERRPPRDPKEGIFNRTLLIRLAILGLIIAIGTFGIFIIELSAGASLERARTMALTTVVFAQFFHVFNSRSERISVFRQNPAENRFLFFSMIAAFTAQMALLYLPFMQTVFRTIALNINDLLITVAIASAVLVGSEIDKLRLRLTEPR
ncbi:MAG: HAD-IC family P-type ATPase [Actinomycetota bacterium]|nr:HAD-IC family P-type ATPase [Actinomycetota bacterium]